MAAAMYFDASSGAWIKIGDSTGVDLDMGTDTINVGSHTIDSTGIDFSAADVDFSLHANASLAFGANELFHNGSNLVIGSSVIAEQTWVTTQIDAALTGLDFQADVLDIQTDNTLDPGASPTTGDRYIISTAASLHANFGTINKNWADEATTLADDDIVEYDGTEFKIRHDVSVEGEGSLIWDRDSNTWQKYDGAAWSEFGGLAGVTAGAGMTKSGDTLDVIAADTSLTINADDMAVNLAANSGLAVSSGLLMSVNALAAAAVDVANDSIAILDATDSSTKKESIADLVSAMAGNGLSAASGVLAVDLGEFTEAAVAVGTDYMVFLDGGATGSEAKESIADFVAAMAGDGVAASSGVLALDINGISVAETGFETGDLFAMYDANGAHLSKITVDNVASGMAGDGLSAAAGVMAVNTDDVGIEINADTLRLKDGGVSADKLSVALTAAATKASNAKGLPVYMNSSSKFVAKGDDTVASSRLVGLVADTSTTADGSAQVYCIDGSKVTPAQANIADDANQAGGGTAAFNPGELVYAVYDSGGTAGPFLVSAGETLGNWLDANDYYTVVGVADSASTLILRIGTPQQYIA